MNGYDGTSGQDRESYTDTQDRESYVPDHTEQLPTPALVEALGLDPSECGECGMIHGQVTS